MCGENAMPSARSLKCAENTVNKNNKGIVTKNNYKHTLRHHDWQLNRSVSADACTFAFPNHRFRCFCFAPLYLPRATRAATLSIFHQMSFCGVCISFAVFY